MLVLTRKYQEKIRIGNNITITVLRMKGKAVRLGIEAPVEVPVVRGELAFDNNPGADAFKPVEVELELAELDSSDECEQRSGRTIAGVPGMKSAWLSNGGAHRNQKSGPAREPATVEFTRVSREELAGVLPKLAKPASGAAPLRAAMEFRRS